MIVIKTIEDMKKVQKKDIIIDNIMKCPGLYCLLAKAKVGKSLLALQIADCIANNKQFLGNGVIPSPVLYISTEVGSSQLLDRMKKMNITFNDSNFFFVEREPNETSICLMDLEVDIKEFAQDYHGKLIIMDMLYGMDLGVAYDLNNYQDMGQKALPTLRKLCDKYHVSILFIHHLNKNGTSLGSTAIDTSVDGKLSLIQDDNIKNRFSLIIESRDFEGQELSLIRNDNLILTIDKEDNTDDLDINLILFLNYIISQKEIKMTSADITSKLQLKITPTKFSRLLNNNLDKLEKQGVYIESYRTATERGYLIKYVQPIEENDV